MAPSRSAYIHVPFCVHRCGYCDFTLLAGRDDLADSYLDALELEIDHTNCCEELDTLFIGGGTPTQLDARQLARLMGIIRDRFELSSDAEISVEANPIGLDQDKLLVLADAGVNRLSLGIQSFDDRDLVTLERDHRRAQVVQCVEHVRQQFSNVSFDLIFAVPGQTAPVWADSLRQALQLQPEHVSTYGLTFEKGTTYWSRRNSGALQQADETLEREMYETAIDTLTSNDFEQYEISSFAQPGFRCRHNQVYWTGKSYQGFGPGAASFIEDTRTTNHRSTTTWLKRTLAGASAVGETERLGRDDRVREFLVLSLRRMDGVTHTAFRDTTGVSLRDYASAQLDRLQQRGLISDDGERVCLTREGLFLFDTVAAELL